MSYAGLTSQEVSERLKRDGFNELPSQKKRGFLFALIEVLKEPMLLLLFCAGLVYFLLGERGDAIMLSTFIVFVLGITFYQQRRTENALEALKNLSSPRALVVRDSTQRRIAGREVVAGDIIILREGDRVPADAVVLESSNLMVDESLLTGESLAVAKSAWDGSVSLERNQPGGDNLPFVYSGTLVTRGHGTARVNAVAKDTKMGKIGKSLQDIREEEMLVRKETARIVRVFGFVGLALCVTVVVFYGLFRGSWLEGFLYGLTISMSMLPEEFPVVLLIFLAFGAWRISKRKVLTRNTAAIETLGAATVLCVDKTGTITLNQMRLEVLAFGGEMIETKDYDNKINILPEQYRHLLEYSMLASQRDPFDPLEKEIKKMDSFLFSSTIKHLWNPSKLIKEYPFSGNILALSHVWESPEVDHYIVASKGAPESIALLCHLSDKEKDILTAQMQPLLDRGLRLIAVAAADVAKSELPLHQHEFSFKFMGLLGFADPIRPSVPKALEECYSAGIRVCMITGDYPGTAQYIAKKIGLKNSDVYITGEELQKLSIEDLSKKISQVNIFARVIPEQKMLIINALKANGEIVAMTGDGVNDAPALKAAHIGIAMGERGTDVARETADLVLLNDDFSSIVQAVRNGRSIFDNLKKAVAFIFSVHIPIAGMSFLPVVLNMPIVFSPAHIAFLELVIDPACSLVFESEPEEKNVMNRPPRNLKESLFGRRAVMLSILQGLSVFLVTFAVFFYAVQSGKGDDHARTLTFITIVLANLMLIVSNLSWSKNIFQTLNNGNKMLLWILGGTLSMLLVILSVPVLRGVFHFSPISWTEAAVAFLAGIVSVVWLEIFKFAKIRFENRKLQIEKK
ncbi:MAG: cation-translocating P-type ATPase [Candidatus Paceibacterota bacterium]|jgi:Ca2+-transporting ATPase